MVVCVRSCRVRHSWRAACSSLPRDASGWPSGLLRRWHEDGGVLTVAAVGALPPDQRAAFIDRIGEWLPAIQLQPMAIHGGLLGAASRDDRSTFSRIAEALFERGWALAEIGAPNAIWPAILAEGKRLQPHMEAGKLSHRNGTLIEGRSPSGAKRGDRYIALGAAAGLGAWPALELLDTALAVVGAQLSDSLCELTGRPLYARTDPFFACFPPGAQYGAHFDGGGGSGRLTMILYTNEAWHEDSGGELQMLDQDSRCWRSISPLAGRLVIFRSDDVLHRVAPNLSERERFALTAWWLFSPGAERQLPQDTTLLLRARRGSLSAGDRCAEHFTLKAGAAGRLLAHMQAVAAPSMV